MSLVRRSASTVCILSVKIPLLLNVLYVVYHTVWFQSSSDRYLKISCETVNTKLHGFNVFMFLVFFQCKLPFWMSWRNTVTKKICRSGPSSRCRLVARSINGRRGEGKVHKFWNFAILGEAIPRECFPLGKVWPFPKAFNAKLCKIFHYWFHICLSNQLDLSLKLLFLFKLGVAHSKLSHLCGARGLPRCYTVNELQTSHTSVLLLLSQWEV